MSKGKGRAFRPVQKTAVKPAASMQTQQPPITVVPSLLGSMVDGNEYGSIVALAPASGDLATELRRGIAELEAVRQRPCLMYLGNIVKPKSAAGMEPADLLPFAEMVDRVPAGVRAVDVFLASDGGRAEVAARLVEALRSRFDEVDFIIPSHAMSAGTLLALSGNRIWMTNRAYLGPVDPQIPSRDGRLVPAQSVLSLLQKMQKEGYGVRHRSGLPVHRALQVQRMGHSAEQRFPCDGRRTSGAGPRDCARPV